MTPSGYQGEIVIRNQIVVVGNGMVGHRFVERLHELDSSGRMQIVVFGEEPRPAYDRVSLSSFFSGRGAEALALADRDWYAERRIDLRLADRVVAIDPFARSGK